MADYALTSSPAVIRNSDGAQLWPNGYHWEQYEDWLATGNTPDPYVAPPPPVPQVISDRQFFQQLAVMGVITTDEALASVGPGTLPAALGSLVAGLPPDQQFAARMLLVGAVEFSRAHPMVEVLGSAFGWSSNQVDDLWRAAALL